MCTSSRRPVSRAGVSLIELTVASFVALMALGMLSLSASTLRGWWLQYQERAMCVRLAQNGLVGDIHGLGPWYYDYPTYANTNNCNLSTYASSPSPALPNDAAYSNTFTSCWGNAQINQDNWTVVSPNGQQVTLSGLRAVPLVAGVTAAEDVGYVVFAPPPASNGNNVLVVNIATTPYTLVGTYAPPIAICPGPSPSPGQPPPPPYVYFGQQAGLAVDSGFTSLYAQDVNNWYCWMADFSGKKSKFSWRGSPNKGCSQPYSNVPPWSWQMWAATDLSVFFCDGYDNSGIRQISKWVPATGNVDTWVPTTPSKHLGNQMYSIGVDQTMSHVWVADPDYMCLRRLTLATGSWSDEIKPGNALSGPSGATAMGSPRGVAVGLSGKVYTDDALNLWVLDPSTMSATSTPLPTTARFFSSNIFAARKSVLGRSGKTDVIWLVTADGHLYEYDDGVWQNGGSPMY